MVTSLGLCHGALIVVNYAISFLCLTAVFQWTFLILICQSYIAKDAETVVAQ